MKLTDRVAIITGASQGLGAAIAERYVAEGASVMLCARGAETLSAQQAHLRSMAGSGQQILIQQADVAHPPEVDALVSASLEAFPHVDILVNNAGVYGPLGPISDVPWEEWVAAIEINLMGTVYACRAILPHMTQRGYGKIVNLSGGGATSPLPRVSAYAASKAAVVRFTETLAVEVGPGVDVNAIAPGALATRLLDEVIAAGPEVVGGDFYARMIQVREEGGTPLEKGASLAVYLASAESDGITGRLISAVWDPWPTLHEHVEGLRETDVYTLRRIVPEDRDLELDG
jgi:NAD(P)-dependent dehydrogenase (short-subunit alcohol dehydrogenase family)